MDIADIYTAEYAEVSPNAPASKLAARFRDTGAKAVVVRGDEYEGVVTGRQLLRSHVPPKTKARSLVWHVPRVRRTEDVRDVARHFVGGQTTVLPVFDGDDLVGVVTADDVLAAVTDHLNVLTVADVHTADPVTVRPNTTVGAALNRLREGRISHLPVVDDDGDAVGVVSVPDLLGVTTREMTKASGGDTGFPEGQSHGGFGAREGDRDTVLDVPVQTVMSDSPVTTTPDRPLGDAVAEMLDRGISSLVVVDGGRPVGIVTKTDALRSLTWTDESKPVVQIHHADLMDDLTVEDVRDTVDALVSKYDAMGLLEANVYFHEHDEKLRGTPLILARIRLFTDKGHFVGSGEGYGAAHALRLAANVVERKILEGKTRGRSKKGRDREERAAAKLYGWYLAGPGECGGGAESGRQGGGPGVGRRSGRGERS